MLTKLSAYKGESVSILIIVVCLSLYLLFPTANVFQQLISSAAFLLVIPLLYIKIVLKKPLAEYGFQLGEKKIGLTTAGISLLISIPLFYVIFSYTGLPRYHNLPAIVIKNFFYFIAYEMLLVGLFAVFYEVFFRGFLTLGFSKIWKYWSIAAQFLVFILFLFLSRGNDWSLIPFAIISPFSAYVAYRSRSLIYSFATTLIFVILADAIAIGLTK
jgi:hypothetical protein